MTPRSVSRRSNSTASNAVSKSDAASGGFSHHSSPRPSRHSSLRQNHQAHPQQNSYNNHHHQQQTSSARNEYARKNAVTQKHQSQRHSSKSGKQNNSNQRPHARSDAAQSKSEDEQQQQQQTVPNKKSGGRGSRKQNKQHGKVTLLTKSASEGEQQAMLSKFAEGQSKRSRRRQASPPRDEDDSVFPQPPAHHGSASVPPGKMQSRSPPRRGHNKQQQQQQQHAVVSGLATIYSPTPQVPSVAPFGSGQSPPSSYGIHRGGSPSSINKSNHYAGASFNNSPAPNTLPLPPMFLTSNSPPQSTVTAAVRDDDVFGASRNAHVRPEQLLVRRPEAQVANVALSERSRQLEDMLVRGNIIHNNNSHSAVDLTQPAADLSAMFQKLRLIKEMSQNRAATVSPMPNGTLTPSYHA